MPYDFLSGYSTLVVRTHTKATAARLSHSSVCCCYSHQCPWIPHVYLAVRFVGTAYSQIMYVNYFVFYIHYALHFYSYSEKNVFLKYSVKDLKISLTNKYKFLVTLLSIYSLKHNPNILCK